MPGLLLLIVSLFVIASPASSSPAESEDYNRARELLANGHATEAAAIYRQLAAADPSKPELYLNLSIALYKAKDFRGAAESADQALKLDSALLPASLFLGASYLELGEFQKAVLPLERVVAGNPSERNGRLMLAKARLALRDFPRAAEEFQTASALLPQNPGVWYGLGRARESLGQKDLADAAWERLAALPASFETHVHAAEEHDAAQRWLEASREWELASNMAADSPAARLGLAGSLFRRRDYVRVMSTVEPLLAGHSPQAPFLYGASLMNLQRPDEAISHLQRALSQDPQLLSAAAALGQALLQTGHPQEAIPFLEKAAYLDTDGSLHFQLFRAYQSTHQKQRAQESFAASQRLRSQTGPVQP